MSANDRHCESIERSIMANETTQGKYRYYFADGKTKDFDVIDEEEITRLTKIHGCVNHIGKHGGVGWRG